MKTRYVIDTNVLIDAHYVWYRPLVFPGFWEWMHLASATGSVCSVRQVRDEIESRPLIEQTRSFGGSFFRELDDDAILSRLLVHVAEQARYTDSALRDFRQGADAHLIAYAMQEEMTVVTGETRDPNSRSRVKIPDVCDAFDVPVMTLSNMIEEAGARFVLDPAVRRDLSDDQQGSTLLF